MVKEKNVIKNKHNNLKEEIKSIKFEIFLCPLFLESLKDDGEALHIIMRDSKGELIQAICENRRNYMVGLESDYIGRWSDHGGQVLSGVYEVKNSKLLKLINEYSIFDNPINTDRHILFIFAEDVIEVSMPKLPEIQILSELHKL